LTPIAGYEGGIVATNLLEGNSATVNYDVVPTIVFSLPPLAGVGFSKRLPAKRVCVSERIEKSRTRGIPPAELERSVPDSKY